jgi:hypothetical protein
MPKAVVEIIGKSERLKEVVEKHGKYFYLLMQRDVAGSPHVTVGDDDITFTTSVRNIRILEDDDS